MKNFLAQVSGALAASQLFVGRAFAALSDPTTPSGLASSTDISSAIITIITWVLNIILIVAVLFVIVAGVRLIISGGDEGQKDKAKTQIIYVIAGIIIVLFARVIVTVINHLA